MRPARHLHRLHHMSTLRRTHARAALIAGAALLAVACDKLWPQKDDLTLPAIDEVRSIYEQHGMDQSIDYSGNVVVIEAVQPDDQLRRGGSLWARVGPYIYLFSPGTRDVMQRYPGVAAVRAITRTADQREIARATLLNDSLGTAQWQRAIHLLGRALQEGTERPVRLQELVRFGEQFTEYRYNRDFIGPR